MTVCGGAAGGVDGARLKSANKKTPASKKKKEESAEVPLSMLEEMQKRLKMRRMGGFL